MEVILADSAGFCYGVRRALDTVLEAAEAQGKPMYTLGPLIHNPQVTERLESQGIRTAEDLGDVPPGSIVVMPSHGVPHQVMQQAQSSGLEIIDVTCPFVEKVHRVVVKLVKEGYQMVVLGDAGHTEVRGIMSVAGDDAVNVSGADELAGRKIKRRVGVVSQTTETRERFQSMVAEISGRAYEVRAFNTICNATRDRQRASLATTAEADVMVVVGGRNSANTRRLEQICSAEGVPTYHVEVAAEMDESWFIGAHKVGVTAGASTPDWVIEEVVERLRGL